MPRSTRSLLAEFNQPRVTRGSAVGIATNAPVNQYTGQVINNPFAPGARRRTSAKSPQQPVEDINLQMARAMFADPATTPEHRSRLQGIISASDPKERERIYEASKAQWQLIAKAAADPNNPLSTGELNQATQEYQTQYVGAALPNPIALYKLEQEADNPKLAIANAAKTIGQEFGLSEQQMASMQYMINLDPKTGRPDPDSVLKARDAFAPQHAKPVDRSGNIKDSLSRVRTMRERLLSDPNLFDEDGNMLDGPIDDNWFGGPSAAKVRAYDDAKTAWEDNIAEENKLIALQQEYSGTAGIGSAPPPPNETVDTGGTASLAQGKNIKGRSATDPFVPEKGDDLDKVLETLQVQANKANVTFYFTDPTTGEVWPVTPQSN